MAAVWAGRLRRGGKKLALWALTVAGIYYIVIISAGTDGSVQVELPMPKVSETENADDIRVRSVARAAKILATVAQSETGLTAAEISRAAQLPPQATYHLLHTLVKVRLLARNEKRGYILGLGMGSLAEAFYRQLSPPPELSHLVRQVAQETGETAYVCGWVDGEIVIVLSHRGSRSVQVSDIPRGTFDNAHARASGKVLLAYAPKSIQADYLATHPMRRRTLKTLTRPEELARAFVEIRERGYAVDEEEYVEGVCCLAVPVGQAAVSHCLTISAPAERFRERKASYIEAMLRIGGVVIAAKLPELV